MCASSDMNDPSLSFTCFEDVSFSTGLMKRIWPGSSLQNDAIKKKEVGATLKKYIYMFLGVTFCEPGCSLKVQHVTFQV